MRQPRRGFTLVELILTMVLVSLTIFGTASIILRGLDAYGLARQRRDAVHRARYATDRMGREIRQIPTPASYILIANGTTFRYATQLVPLTFVTFTFAGGQLRRGADLLADNLTGANQFSYFNPVGLPAVGIADIARVRIDLTVSAGTGYGTVPLQTDIYLRNRYYTGFSQP